MDYNNNNYNNYNSGTGFYQPMPPRKRKAYPLHPWCWVSVAS